MFFVHALFAFVAALLVTFLYVLVVGMHRGLTRDAGMGAILVLFAVIFLTAWAGGVWLMPVGPPMWEVSWVPFLAAAVLAALLIAAATAAPREPRATAEGGTGERLQAASRIALGAFFWVLLAVLILAVLAGYWVR